MSFNRDFHFFSKKPPNTKPGGEVTHNHIQIKAGLSRNTNLLNYPDTCKHSLIYY